FISNAFKFTEQGEVRVSARLNADGRTITFAVADTGIGIEPADQSRIFEEFTQLPNRLQTRVKGTGLGLPLCRRLARLLGGDVGVDSSPGVGSTFTATVALRYEPPHMCEERPRPKLQTLPVVHQNEPDAHRARESFALGRH